MSYEIPALLAGLLIGAAMAYYYYRTRVSAKISTEVSSQVLFQAQRLASELFESQKEQLEKSIHATYDAEFEKWKATTLSQAIDQARADAVNTSRVVLRGKIAEQIAPLLPEFLANFHPADAKFIGSPIDYLIFKNMNKGPESEDQIELVLLDVKTGKSQLTPIQKKIQNAADEKRIRFEVLRIETEGKAEEGTPPTITTIATDDIPNEAP